MLLLIDNYDSFTFNLSHYLQELGQTVKVVRNDELTLSQIEALQPERIVISPGPCTPNESGISLAVIEAMAGKLPILGVCLGHQCIAQVFGGKIVKSPRVMHGKISAITTTDSQLFRNIPRQFNVTRYHSLVIDEATVPKSFSVTASCFEAERHIVMAIEHLNWPLFGVQFHPESVLSEFGHEILRNFVDLKA